MIYYTEAGQVSYGEAIGILLLDTPAPYIPGDVANATTFKFPVRFKRVPELTVKRIFNHDMGLKDSVVKAAIELKREGVKAITGNCGFMAIYQEELIKKVDLPIFMSSLLQIPFIKQLIKPTEKIGIVTANAKSLDETVLRPCGANLGERLVIRGLEDCPNFASAIIEERKLLDIAKVEAEVVSTACDILKDAPEVRLLLLECSVLPPYGPAVQRATGLPVFDFITMINYVYSTVIKQTFSGYM